MEERTQPRWTRRTRPSGNSLSSTAKAFQLGSVHAANPALALMKLPIPHHLTVGALALGIGWSLAVQADNWPGFRGMTHQGLSTETGLPLHWNSTTNVAWKTAIPGESW